MIKTNASLIIVRGKR